MDGTIYLIGKDGELEAMSQQPYEKEDVLQGYLEKYHNLLAGEQMNESDPRRWLFVSREMGVPKEEGGSDTWSLDHLFLDQDGIPTLVEVKRSSDTRSRREVVAQMLDYAANAVVHWPMERIRTRFEAICQEQGIEPVDRIRESLGLEDVEDFWEKTKTNLQAEKIRLVFVADRIPQELRLIVAFLNRQMDPAEVLAVEIPQYVGESQTVVVPRVLGLTPKPGRPPTEKKAWDETSFFSSLEKLNPAAVKPTKEIYEWGKARKLTLTWGTGAAGSFGVSAKNKATAVKIIGVEAGFGYKYGVRIYFQAGTLRTFRPFTDKTKMLDIVVRLSQILGVDMGQDIVDDKTPRFPGFPISLLQDEPTMKQFLDTLELIAKEIEDAGQ